ncbi:signal peptide protein [Fusarium albosuccineum]|uniref:Signal peptide protein n=1 Tax=Fusarium albosuccineum TaxID=1237068 RepID=A0A8H4PCM6_9HYPO|nr:signal peptide protein [Fusarium albosuccineum]
MKPTVAFAPGAWHTADCFDVVQNTPPARGWLTETAEYPSVGAERLTRRLADDANAVRATVNLCDTDANISRVITITKMPLRKQTEIEMHYEASQRRNR